MIDGYRVWHKRCGFTLIELMIVVAIIGILAAMAIPQYRRFQLKSKSAEAKANIGAIRTAEYAYSAEHGAYRAASANPAIIPGNTKGSFDRTAADFGEIGWSPNGEVFFSYGVAANEVSFTIDAGADIDVDGVNQYWGYVESDKSGNRLPGVVGCDVTGVVEHQIDRCSSGSGQSVF